MSGESPSGERPGLGEKPRPGEQPRRLEAIAIGASAGGVEALGRLLPALPGGLDATVLVVLHLPAGQPSLLASLLAPRCALAVCEAEDKQPLAPGTIHFAPPGYHLLVEPDRTLSLSVDPPVHFARPSIDVLFESAAWTYGPGLLGVVLTGANADGAAGLAAIRAAGGLAWVQDPADAQVATMPAAALAAAGADRVMPLARMVEAFARLPERSEPKASEEPEKPGDPDGRPRGARPDTGFDEEPEP